MAEFNSYLLGKVTKSVGNITLVYTKRKNIAKAKVFKRKDNPTPEILEQRAKMKTLVQFGRRILPVVRKGFAGVGRGAGSVATIDYGRLLLASGLQRVRIVALNNRGVAGETEYALPEEWEASKVEAYCFATSPNGRMVSDSMHLTV